MQLKTSIEAEISTPNAALEWDTIWLLERWREMRRIRRAEEVIAEMVTTGEARCPCHLYIGQEAVAAGVCAALRREDTVWGGHRSHGHYLAKGGSLTGLFAEILGKAIGCSEGRGGSMHLLAEEVGILGTVPIVAGTVPLAAGAALAAKMRGTGNVAVAFFGDGSMEEGHIHETLNLAALYKLPLLFVCENNLYSSHLHLEERRVADNIYRAGEFHSVPGIRVDGNDVSAVYESAQNAVDRARAGNGPTLLECRTFRWRGHVGASTDIDVGVRRRGELDEWLKLDPIQQVGKQLTNINLAPHIAQIEDEIQAALDSARAAPLPAPARVLEHTWSTACAN
jgi:acetoin:2,6-dichlorophenolindophenol oxidoreductase subunit alpha